MVNEITGKDGYNGLVSDNCKKTPEPHHDDYEATLNRAVECIKDINTITRWWEDEDFMNATGETLNIIAHVLPECHDHWHTDRGYAWVVKDE